VIKKGKSSGIFLNSNHQAPLLNGIIFPYNNYYSPIVTHVVYFVGDFSYRLEQLVLSTTRDLSRDEASIFPFNRHNLVTLFHFAHSTLNPSYDPLAFLVEVINLFNVLLYKISEHHASFVWSFFFLIEIFLSQLLSALSILIDIENKEYNPVFFMSSLSIYLSQKGFSSGYQFFPFLDTEDGYANVCAMRRLFEETWIEIPIVYHGFSILLRSNDIEKFEIVINDGSIFVSKELFYKMFYQFNFKQDTIPVAAFIFYFAIGHSFKFFFVDTLFDLNKVKIDLGCSYLLSGVHPYNSTNYFVSPFSFAFSIFGSIDSCFIPSSIPVIMFSYDNFSMPNNYVLCIKSNTDKDIVYSLLNKDKPLSKKRDNTGRLKENVSTALPLYKMCHTVSSPTSLQKDISFFF